MNHFVALKTNVDMTLTILKQILGKKKKTTKPLLNAIQTTLSQLEHLTPKESRDILYEAFTKTKPKFSHLPPLYMIGGTGLGGMYALKQVPAPYLPAELPEGKKYTLVLDLDETLVHYVEIPGT